MNILTMTEEWRNYRDAVYPKDVPASQNRECHQAFFAGALQALAKMTQISELPEPEAMVAVEKLNREVIEVCRARAATLAAGELDREREREGR